MTIYFKKLKDNSIVFFEDVDLCCDFLWENCKNFMIEDGSIKLLDEDGMVIEDPIIKYCPNCGSKTKYVEVN